MLNTKSINDNKRNKVSKYGHVTEQMKRDSADRMQQYINRVKKSG